MTRRSWISFNALGVTTTSLVAAVHTGNENWPTNIPVGLLIGALWGWASWPLLRWFQGR